MSADSAYRLEDLLALTTEEQLGKLAGRLECRPTLSELRDAILRREGAEPVWLIALDEEVLGILHSLVAVLPMAVEDLEGLAQPLEVLVGAGLAYVLEIQEEKRIYVPLEVQLELHERQPQPDPDLRVLLVNAEEDTLGRLEGIFLEAESEEEISDSPMERVCRLASAMETPSTLREIHDGLPATAREVLGWTCEHGGPIRSDELEQLTRDAAEYHQEKPEVAIGQLLRFGLLISHEPGQTGEIYLVPRSLRPILSSFHIADLTARAQACYEELTAGGHLSFPDEGPHGWGGNAHRAFRQYVASWVSGQEGEKAREFGVAAGMQLIDPEGPRAGMFASLLLDLSSETAFARQALRYWLAIIDDPWTMDLMRVLGGEPERLVAYFTSNPEGIETGDVDLWFGYLFTLRAQLLVLMSLIPPGRWFSLSDMARLYHLLSARCTLSYLSPPMFSPLFPFEALPDYGVVIARQDRLGAVQRWLVGWLGEFVSLLGAAELDEGEEYFRVHPDSFCVFRDTDLWFQRVWDDMAKVVGEDLDIWMPMPNDPGPRIRGVAPLRAVGDRVVAPEQVHLFDLIQLANWADPVVEPGGFGFSFTQRSVNRGLERGLNGEEMLLWLAVRLNEEMPPGYRALFPHSSSAVDGSPEQWRRAASSRVEELIQSLEHWGASPPGRLMEEIRSWGAAAVGPLVDRLRALLGQGRVEDLLIGHLCLLLGELGAEGAVPFLLAVIRGSPGEGLQHAAAAACMRIGRASVEELVAMMRSSTVPKERRLIAAMALTGLSTLHPGSYEEVTDALIQVVEGSAYDTDLQTRLTLELCRTGHIKAEPMVESLQNEESWNSDSWEPEDALWLARISPCVWGSLLFSIPLPMLYLVSEEADQLASESGVREMIRKAGLNTEAFLYGRSRGEEPE
ncbi:MAG: hypothetical protein JW797_19375 [Bradymonadales bacterium]|nr:hypothetical protein [Bradymonadales bacterium]